jgi:uncharacterized YkwD family protein
MKKKMVLSIAAAAAILAANPVMDKADASTTSPSVKTKVNCYQNGNLSNEQIDSILQKYFKNYQINWNQQQPVKAQAPTTAKQPAKAPAPVQQPAKAPAPAEQPAKAPAEKPVAAPSTAAVSAYEQKVAELTNQERTKNGLKPLALDTELSKVAREKSRDMQSKNYFSHTSPTYGSPFDMMKKFGITYRSAGENIAMGQPTPEAVVKAWMNSDGHRKNILSPNFTHIGVGHVASGNYWTQMFIGK